jgi:hypothetical protein
MVTWIPSIYPLYVSIYKPAPWILNDYKWSFLAKNHGTKICHVEKNRMLQLEDHTTF